MLKYLEMAPQSPSKRMLVMLHGYGSNEADLFSFAGQLNSKYLVVSAQAPLPLGYGSYAWYNISFSEDASRFGNPEEALQALVKIAEFVAAQQKKHGILPENTTILGFSQGAILSYALAFHHPEMVGHVAALSGYVYDQIMPESPDLEAIQKIRFLATHGVEDPVIPFAWSEKAADFLFKNGLQVSYQAFDDMGHGINQECFDMLTNWLGLR